MNDKMKLVHVRLEKRLERIYGRWNTKTEGRSSFTYIRDSLFSRGLENTNVAPYEKCYIFWKTLRKRNSLPFKK